MTAFIGFYCAYRYDLPLGPAEVATTTTLLVLVGAGAGLRRTIQRRLT